MDSLQLNGVVVKTFLENNLRKFSSFWLRCEVWVLSEKYDVFFLFNKETIDASSPDVYGRKNDLKGKEDWC